MWGNVGKRGYIGSFIKNILQALLPRLRYCIHRAVMTLFVLVDAHIMIDYSMLLRICSKIVIELSINSLQTIIRIPMNQTPEKKTNARCRPHRNNRDTHSKGLLETASFHQ